ncbi:unnamed protein product [Lupinus luteus]|uniref:Uncharacterized protein n=1 Tax=Lupinus luteus TaxID=3873 RepID=A0AAV1WP73_LUPLU
MPLLLSPQIRPSTFAQAAKLKILAAAKEKELTKCEADDYKMNNITGENLRNMGMLKLKTISELQEEEDQKHHKLVSNLHNIIQAKNQHLKEIEVRCSETTLKMDVEMGKKISSFKLIMKALKIVKL